MCTATTFLQAIRDDPADDDLRLVFADWLDEHDDPRGEVMRLEVTLSRLAPDDPERDRLGEHSGELQRRAGRRCGGGIQSDRRSQ